MIKLMDYNNDYSKDYFDSGESKIGQYASYDFERFYPAFRAMVNKLKKDSIGGKILDIGCAKGFLVDVFRNEGYEAYGIDISEYAIEQSPTDIKQFLSVCDLNNDLIPFDNFYFDVIICMGTLEYLKCQNNALNEMSRILKPGGYLFVTTLGYVPEGDEFRKFAKNEIEWNKIFNRYGFLANRNMASKIISEYVKKINLYDIRKSINVSKSRSVKHRILKFFLNTNAKHLIVEYFYRKQLNSGYLMLCYNKLK